jgi:hypothetical protein
MFSASVTVEVGDGATARFWTDAWLPDGAIRSFAPNLYAAVGKRSRRRTVKDALCNRRWVRDITGARTAAVINDYLHLWELLMNVQLRESKPDRFVWRWSPDGRYSVKTAYRAFFTGWTTMAGATELWRVRTPPKVKFFFWLALHERLWTNERRMRHGLQADAACSLCDQLAETVDHLLCACVYTREVWSRLLFSMGSPTDPPQHDSTLCAWWLAGREALLQGLSKSFDSLVLLVVWNIWKERNRRVFDSKALTPTQLLHRIREEGDEWIGAGYSCLALLTTLVA